MRASKRERLEEMFRRFSTGGPYDDGEVARNALAEVMRQVEDEFSGIPENPHPENGPSDGRMYPPHDDFERESGCELVRLFRTKAHLVFFGANGATLIRTVEGQAEVDLQGADGRTVEMLFAEHSRELN